MYTIIRCWIKPYSKLSNDIYVQVKNGEIIHIGHYFTDELHFDESEFVGLTLGEAKQLIRDRDVAYLRS